ncbi:MAG: acyl-CoA synthetase [Vicinamibacterales bacterium]
MDSGLGIVARAAEHGARRALIAPEGTFSYDRLLRLSSIAASALLAGAGDLEEGRVAFLCPPGARYVATQLAIWRAGGVAVPLGTTQAADEWDYIMSDARAATVVASHEFMVAIEPIGHRNGARIVAADIPDRGGELEASSTVSLPAVAPSRRAMIIYTSGTTSRPKGVVTSHQTLETQVTTLVEAWGWSADDHVLNVLPLNHVHGIVNVLACALWAGATCEFLQRFDAALVWERLASGEVTVFMAVPTIYAKLLAYWEKAPEGERRALSAGASRLRLMVSGSAALPVSLLERWREATGHVLLERYGMTEIGMALSNPLHGERRPGSVGTPLPGVEVRLVDEDGQAVRPGEPGEIEVRGKTVFLEYWNQPEATSAAFRGGWFRTGDVAVVEDGRFRILGRRSVDIIKTGGYKVSSLEIEEVLRTHPLVADCAVVGVEDDEWGERVAAAIVPAAEGALERSDLAAWARERMAPYKVPTRLLFVRALPRNAIGKVTKTELRKLFTMAS